MDEIRNSTVAGNFYPKDTGELYQKVKELIENAPGSKGFSPDSIKALIVPHSGYELAGKVYAAAYATIQSRQTDEVFIISTSAFHKAEKAKFANFQKWETPLGLVEQSHRVDKIVIADDSNHNVFESDNKAHKGEFRVEVQLPFLQYLFNEKFRILPVIMGDVSPRLVAQNLNRSLDTNDLLIVPAELSHNLPKSFAEEIDNVLIEKIISLDLSTVQPENISFDALSSVSVACELAKLRGWKAQLLLYMNSAESTGDEHKTHGYAAIAFIE